MHGRAGNSSRNGISSETRLGISLKVTLGALGNNEGGVLLKLDSGEMYTINDTTAAFIAELDGSKRFADVVHRLSTMFDVDVDILEADLVEIADDLIDQQLIHAIYESAT
jgi:hypothetical protein